MSATTRFRGVVVAGQACACSARRAASVGSTYVSGAPGSMAARPARAPKLAQSPLSGRDFRRLIDGQLSEADWQKQVERALTVCGWWWLHVPSNVTICPRCHTKVYRGIAKGFPDILAIKPPHILWIELKRDRASQLDPEQRRVGAMLRACGQIWVHARPRDRQRLIDLIAHPEKESFES